MYSQCCESEWKTGNFDLPQHNIQFYHNGDDRNATYVEYTNSSSNWKSL